MVNVVGSLEGHACISVKTGKTPDTRLEELGQRCRMSGRFLPTVPGKVM